jgi:hypothetical protein
MAEFREFYIQTGAGSCFLAGKCLWTDMANNYERNTRTSTNEFFFDREQINKVWNNIPDEYECDDENLTYESKRILPILTELRKFIEGEKALYFVDQVITEVKWNKFWKLDWSMCTPYFWHHEDPNKPVTDDRANAIQEAKDYFTKCREYYFNVCERNDWNSFIISHQHPYIWHSTSSQLQFPENFKSLAMKLDSEIDSYLRHLVSIKHNHPLRELIGVGKTNISCRFSDETVSYRKIFFENNENEIRKMYEFFDNEDYFDKNITNIIKEFKEYNDDNMAVLKQHMPNVYEQTKQ